MASLESLHKQVEPLHQRRYGTTFRKSSSAPLKTAMISLSDISEV